MHTAKYKYNTNKYPVMSSLFSEKYWSLLLKSTKYLANGFDD